jgi:hypothetical protein
MRGRFCTKKRLAFFVITSLKTAYQGIGFAERCFPPALE